MIRGIGIDAVELPRMKKIIEEKPKMITRILTVREKELFDGLPLKRQIEFLGGRYACKEAFSKLGVRVLAKSLFKILKCSSTKRGHRL